MKNISIIFISFILTLGFCQAQEGDNRAADEKWIWNVPELHDDVKYWEPSLKKYSLAETVDILGKWEFGKPTNSTIEFKSSDLENTFYFYDSTKKLGSSGEWIGSYTDNILVITLNHLKTSATEEIAVQIINNKTLALGSIVDGKFVYRYRVRQQ